MKPTLSVVLPLFFLAIVLSGCDVSDETSSNTAEESQSSEAPEDLDPVAFESIPLASDTSFESQSIVPGSEAGEVRDLTPLKIKFSWCPPGTFVMGSAPDAFGRMQDEDQHEVTLTNGFWMQQTEVTQAQYEALMGVNPSFYPGDQQPVESITWIAAVEYCRRLSELPAEKSAGNVYRLPTEAEWEYACRAGTTTVFSFGEDEKGAEEFGWYLTNSERTTQDVGGKQPNPWGLYDMHGNVAEWCHDWYSLYPQTAVTDPVGAESGEDRIIRGGSWFQLPEFARCSHRNGAPPSSRYVARGFRVVAVPAGSNSVAEAIATEPAAEDVANSNGAEAEATSE